MEAKQKTKIYNLIVLDKSGSMSSIRTEAVNGYNETLGSIRATQLKFIEDQEHFVSLATFCGCGIQLVHDAVPIKDAQNLTRDQYRPCCRTPLYDAIGTSVNSIKNKLCPDSVAAVLVTIITDGEENSSREWSLDSITQLIEEQKKAGWMFSFIGAGEDVLKAAESISITNTREWCKSAEGTALVLEEENEARARFCRRLRNKLSSKMSQQDKIEIMTSLSESFYEGEDKEA